MDINFLSREVFIGLASALSLFGVWFIKKAFTLNITDSPEPDKDAHKKVYMNLRKFLLI